MQAGSDSIVLFSKGTAYCVPAPSVDLRCSSTTSYLPLEQPYRTTSSITMALKASSAAAGTSSIKAAKPCRMVVRAAPSGTPTLVDSGIKITKLGATDALENLAKFSLDDYVAGKSKTFTFWNCAPSDFPWSYAKVEYAYVLEGKFTVTYPGAAPVEINAGDFVRFPVGETQFSVKEHVRKFFTLVDEE